jgi:hypothetical protein
LVTGRSKAIPAYFVGHWVEIRAAATGALKGVWRIAAIGVNGLTVTLAPNAGETVPVEVGDGWQGVYRFDRYTVRGQLQVLSADPIYVFSEQVVTGVVETSSVHAKKLTIEAGAQLTQPLTLSAASPASLTIEVDELVVKPGGVIDVTGRGYPPSVTYPGHAAPGTFSAGSHMGEGGLNNGPVGQTFGSVYFPQENGGGGWDSRSGGSVRIVAGRVQVDGAIRANGGAGCTAGGAGGSVWIRSSSSLSGTGTIEAKGGDSACGDRSGGGGAISLDYTSLDPVSTLLDHLNAQGGAIGVTGGAGTIFLHGPSAILGSLTVDNKTVTGSKRTVLPSLGRGIVQTGSTGGTVLTGRDANVPAYFIGSWLEVEGQDRFVKGVWRIASINGTTITLEPKATQPFTIAPGDRWRGIYRFDQVTVASSSVLVSTDTIVQLVPPLPAPSIALKAAKAGDNGTEVISGNDEAPAWVKSAISIAVGSVPGSYRITLGPGAVSDPDGIAEVSLTSGGRSVSAGWSTDGASFLWAGRPGQQLHLVATDAHPRFRRSGWLELPPLPTASGWGAQLELAAGVTPLAVTGGADWLAVADSGVWLYGAAPQPTDALPPRTKDEEVLTLAGGEPRLFAATRDRVDLLDRTTRALQEVQMPASTAVLDVAPGAGGATLLVSDTSDPAGAALRLIELLAPEGGAPSLSAPGEQALPLLAAPALQRTAGYLHLLGLKQDGKGAIYTWPDSTPLTAISEVSEVPAGWRAVGPWERGAVLLDATAVRLYEHDDQAGAGWSEASHVDLPAAASSAAVAGNNLVVILPGEVMVYDVSNAAAPVLKSRHPGSSYRQVTPLSGGQVLLWSRRMATPPLRWDPATAIPGDGFHTVIDGLP